MEIHNPHGEDAHGSVTNVTGYRTEYQYLVWIASRLRLLMWTHHSGVAKPIQLPAPSRGIGALPAHARARLASRGASLPLTRPQLALPCLDPVLRCAAHCCLVAGVASSELAAGLQTRYREILDLLSVVDGTSAPLPPACDFPCLRRSRPAPRTAAVLRYPARSRRCAPRGGPPGWWGLSHRSHGTS